MKKYKIIFEDEEIFIECDKIWVNETTGQITFFEEKTVLAVLPSDSLVLLVSEQDEKEKVTVSDTDWHNMIRKS